ncbi:16382_t:CDS:2 [Acaulospora colombiana]|uniref:16382_t:CDS:1 n=1 Tax=Acaulospora colombiana TaxID=27376 RepID=A0ACA9KEL0_9GLOM|nr:16382_t:CDS:2 [Acaulospora colombiana]
MNFSQPKKFEANAFEFERESELSENSGSNYRGYSSEPNSSYDNGEGSVTSLDFWDEFDFESTSDDTQLEGELWELFVECFSESPEVELLFEKFKEYKERNELNSFFDLYLNGREEESARSYTSSSPAIFTVREDDDDNDPSRLKKPRKRKKKKRQDDSYPPNFDSSPASLQSPASASLSSSWDAQWPPLPSSTPPENKMRSYSSIIKENVDLAYNNKLNLTNQRESIKRLSEIFPQHDVQLLEEILENVNGVVERAINILLEVENTEICSNVETSESRISQKKKNRNNSTKSQSIMRSSFIISSSRFSRDEKFSDEEEYSDYDPDHCRKMVNDLTEKRNDAFKQALKSWRNSRNSRNGEGAIASHYSRMGHDYDEEIKKWKMRAARSVVQQRSKAGGDDYLLDLHGLTVNEALTVVRERLRKWYSKDTTKSGKKDVCVSLILKSISRSSTFLGNMSLRPLKIITGVGNHSPRGIAKLPDAVSRFLDEHNWIFSRDKGYVLVKGLRGNNALRS